jgi:hypothetical protein
MEPREKNEERKVETRKRVFRLFIDANAKELVRINSAIAGFSFSTIREFKDYCLPR